ncbi:MAG: Lacal_2735 family protein [Pseudomonadaceae bacterium]|nr:MAG: Lacal_2735 family protein [Pseudomonadaceae bacterium]
MFGFLRQDPQKKLRKEYNAKLEAAMTAQRNGDIRTYSMLSQEADALWRELEAMEKAD